MKKEPKTIEDLKKIKAFRKALESRKEIWVEYEKELNKINTLERENSLLYKLIKYFRGY